MSIVVYFKPVGNSKNASNSWVDTIEGFLDELEDNKVKVEGFRDSLGKVWNEWEKLSEQV